MINMTTFVRITAPEVKTFLFAVGALMTYSGITNIPKNTLISFIAVLIGAYFIMKAVE